VSGRFKLVWENRPDREEPGHRRRLGEVMNDTSVVGYRFDSEEGSVRRFANGRVCANGECSTRLSIYNDGDFCARHEPMTTLRTRGVKIA
jgi:hypothetical protein